MTKEDAYIGNNLHNQSLFLTVFLKNKSLL